GPSGGRKRGGQELAGCHGCCKCRAPAATLSRLTNLALTDRTEVNRGRGPDDRRYNTFHSVLILQSLTVRSDVWLLASAKSLIVGGKTANVPGSSAVSLALLAAFQQGKTLNSSEMAAANLCP